MICPRDRLEIDARAAGLSDAETNEMIFSLRFVARHREQVCRIVIIPSREKRSCYSREGEGIQSRSICLPFICYRLKRFEMSSRGEIFLREKERRSD